MKRLLWCDYCNEQGNSLESECDSLRWALRKQKELDSAEIDRLKAELGKWEGAHGLDRERNLWKSKAEKLTETLREISKELVRYESRGDDQAWYEPSPMAKRAKAALAEFEGWGFR